MKNLAISIFLFFSSTLVLPSQKIDCLWGRSVYSTHDNYAENIHTDSQGNVYISGGYSGLTAFGILTLKSNGYDGLYNAKYSPEGNILWVNAILGTKMQFAKSCIDKSGNLFMAGYFDSPELFIGDTILVNKGSWDIFVAKYDSSGKFLWVKSVSGDAPDYVHDVDVDQSGNVIITGKTISTYIKIDSYDFQQSSSNRFDIFALKFNSNGKVMWMKSFGGTGDDSGTNITIDQSGAAYISGFFSSKTMKFGDKTFVNKGDASYFIAKYDSTGHELWAHSEESNVANEDMTTSNSGDVYASGYFRGTITFGNFILSTPNKRSIYLLKYDSSGTLIWATSTGASHSEWPYGITTDLQGNIYLVNLFKDSVVRFGSTTLNSSGHGDILILKYNTNGDIVWAKSSGGEDLNYASDIKVDSKGAMYITGYYYGSTIRIGNVFLINYNYSGNSMFVAKLQDEVQGINTTNSLDNSWNIFPNPSANLISIQCDYYQRDLIIKLYNSLGQEVYHCENVTGSSVTIDRGNLPTGVYVLQISSQRAVLQTQKVIFID